MYNDLINNVSLTFDCLSNCICLNCILDHILKQKKISNNIITRFTFSQLIQLSMLIQLTI